MSSAATVLSISTSINNYISNLYSVYRIFLGRKWVGNSIQSKLDWISPSSKSWGFVSSANEIVYITVYSHL